MEAIVGEEWGESGSRVFGVVVGEFRHGEEAGPVCVGIRRRFEGTAPVRNLAAPSGRLLEDGKLTTDWLGFSEAR